MAILEDDEYGKDMAILWAAHKAGTFGLGEIEQDKFADVMLEIISQYDSAWVVDDKNDVYPAGRGPIGIFLIKSDGKIIQPSLDFFKWATHRNILRAVVAFLNWVRYSKDVSLCVINGTPESKNMYWRMRDYGIMVTYVGNGLFVLAGEKSWQGQ